MSCCQNAGDAIFIGTHGAAVALSLTLCYSALTALVRFATTPRPFLILSKLTYGVYLVHWIYQMSATATLRAPYHQSDFKTVRTAVAGRGGAVPRCLRATKSNAFLNPRNSRHH